MTTLPEEAVTLWAVNIHGPDDLIAAPDYLSAVRMANAFNAWWLGLKTKQPHNDAIDARMWAIPTDWPGNDAQGHAVELSKPHPEYQWLREALSALEPSAGRAAVLEEGYRQGIEAAAKLIECGCKALPHGKGECQFPGNCSLEDAAAIRALSSPDHIADAGKVEGDGWLPIESAPKDGTVIDLWSDEYGRLTDCYWGSPMAYEGGETGWVHAHSNEWAESPDEFVHWRPLPLPPVKGGQNG